MKSFSEWVKERILADIMKRDSELPEIVAWVIADRELIRMGNTRLIALIEEYLQERESCEPYS